MESTSSSVVETISTTLDNACNLYLQLIVIFVRYVKKKAIGAAEPNSSWRDHMRCLCNLNDMKCESPIMIILSKAQVHIC